MDSTRERRSSIRRAAKEAIPALLEEAGGQLDTREINRRVKDKYPRLCDDSIVCPHEKGRWHHPEWEHIVAHGIQDLRKKGVIENRQKGTWALVGFAGPERASTVATPAKAAGPLEGVPAAGGKPALGSGPEAQAVGGLRQDMLSRLKGLSAAGFERLCGRLLGSLGYGKVEITGRSGDGGIDGRAELVLGIEPLKVAFQAKRWTDRKVRADDFRTFAGGLLAEDKLGIYMTTSSFTDEAAESARHGMKPVILLDGEAIVGLMIREGLGITTRPLVETVIDDGFFGDFQP